VDTGHVSTVRVVPPHGTRARYLHRTLTCRCAACTAENTAYMADYRRRLARAAGVRHAAYVQLQLPAELLPRARR
jgi:hypothetical protein